MSTILISPNHIASIYYKAYSYRYNKNVFSQDYCYSLSSAMSDERLRQTIKQWYELNIISYNRRYQEQDDIDSSFIDKLNYDNYRGQFCNAYQMLKLLECLSYNIDICLLTDEEKRKYDNSIRLLNSAIRDISSSIIRNTTEYSLAEWAI